MSESAAAAPSAAEAAATAAPAAAQDLYAVLGCAKGDDAPVLTKKYRKLALKYDYSVRCGSIFLRNFLKVHFQYHLH